MLNVPHFLTHMLNFVMLNVVNLTIIMVNDVMLSVIMLNIDILNVVMLSVLASRGRCYATFLSLIYSFLCQVRVFFKSRQGQTL
jgi:hypothetical protein